MYSLRCKLPHGTSSTRVCTTSALRSAARIESASAASPAAPRASSSATGSRGPWLVPYSNHAQIADIRLSTRVNGETRQDDRTGRLIFGFRYLLHYISTFTTLVPGDVIVTGTPTGAGARFDPPRYLKPGDVIEVEADGVGILRNGVVDEAS